LLDESRDFLLSIIKIKVSLDSFFKVFQNKE
jgi:hypothetical protein